MSSISISLLDYMLVDSIGGKTSIFSAVICVNFGCPFMEFIFIAQCAKKNARKTCYSIGEVACCVGQVNFNSVLLG